MFAGIDPSLESLQAEGHVSEKFPRYGSGNKNTRSHENCERVSAIAADAMMHITGQSTLIKSRFLLLNVEQLSCTISQQK